MQDQPKTMQQLADELHSIIVQEIYPDGLRVSAIPISSLLPKPILTNDGFTWQIRPRKVNITPRILVRELSQMNPQDAIFPRLFGLHAAEALQSLKKNPTRVTRRHKNARHKKSRNFRNLKRRPGAALNVFRPAPAVH